MYLPVLLYDRYGWQGAVVFAVPNLLGIVLFGRVVRTAAMSRAMTIAHRPAMIWFSIVTVAFHVFFLAWIWPVELQTGAIGPMVFSPAVFLVSVLTAQLRDGALLRCGIAVLTVSLVMLVLSLVDLGQIAQGGAGNAPIAARPAVWPAGDPGSSIFLLPVFSLGFLMCPYFDLTFHRAYQAVGGGRNGALTFMIFALLFAVMLAFTAVYSVTGLTWVVTIHITCQSWITMTLHLRELEKVRSRRDPRALTRIVRWLPLLAIVPAAVPLVDYLHWYAFYGIVFPAIGMLVIVRRHWLHRCPASPLELFGVILLSLPLGYYGFKIHGEWLLLIPAAMLIIFAFACRPVVRARNVTAARS